MFVLFAYKNYCILKSYSPVSLQITLRTDNNVSNTLEILVKIIVLMSSIVKYHCMCSVPGDSSERRGRAGERYGSGAA